MAEHNEQEKEEKQDLLAEIQSILEEAVERGEFIVNKHQGSKDESIGGGPTSFRMNAYLAHAVEEAFQDLKPIFGHRTHLYKSALTMFCDAWARSKKWNIAPEVKASLDAEKKIITSIREESARQELLNRVKMMGTIVKGYKEEGDVEYAVALLRNWMDLIKQEPSKRFSRRYKMYLQNQPEVMNILTDAEVRGIQYAKEVKEFLLEENEE